jgi:hypothetical protein
MRSAPVVGAVHLVSSSRSPAGAIDSTDRFPACAGLFPGGRLIVRPLKLSVGGRLARLSRLVEAAALLLSAAGCAAAASPAPDPAPELLAKARDRGTVRVLVQVRAPDGAGGTEIEAVKRAALAELVATRHRVVRELPGLPVMALEVSEEALRALSTSPHVLRIGEDRLQRPLR